MIRRIGVAAMLMAALVSSCSSGSDDSTSGPGTQPDLTAASTTQAPSTDLPPSTAPAPTDAATTVPEVSTTADTPTYAATIDELLGLGRPIVLAHTAGEDAYPASTLFAFGESVKAGVDVLDLNVNLTADGELLVQHDETLDRNTDGTGAVIDLTAAEAATFDAAYWFSADCADCRDLPDDAYLYRGIRTGERPPPDGYTADDFALPTLRQLVERFPELPLNIEIKGEGDIARRAADELAAELEELGRSKATVVASFQDDIVAYFHEIAPEVEVSAGLDALTAYVLDATPLPDGMRILQLPPEYSGIRVLTPELIARASSDGLPIWVWPNDRSLENLESYREFLAEGIAGLNINFPVEGVEAVQEVAAASQALAGASSGCRAVPDLRDEFVSIESTEAASAAGLDGTYVLHLPPAYDGVNPLPVVIGLHGWSQPAELLGVQGDLSALADQQRFVLVLPDITRPVPLWDTALDGADVDWFGALLDRLAESNCIDTNRVYLAGMSNGSMMTSTLVCTNADRIAAVATVAGLRLPDGCEPSRAVPIVAFHGTADEFLAFDGGFGDAVAALPNPDGDGTLGDVVGSGADALPVEERAAGWAELNGCGSTPVDQRIADDVTLQGYDACDAPVELYVIEGGGHTWPGSQFDQGIAEIVGPTTTELDASEVMLHFFREHPLG